MGFKNLSTTGNPRGGGGGAGGAPEAMQVAPEAAPMNGIVCAKLPMTLLRLIKGIGGCIMLGCPIFMI